MIASDLVTVERFETSFAQAAETLGNVEQHLVVAGRPVTIRYAGEGIRDVFCRPFTHLRQAAHTRPELTIDVWDSHDSQTAPPPLPPRPPAALDGHKSIIKSDGLRVVHYIGADLMVAIAPGEGRAWVWAADRNTIPFWETAAPFKMVWRWWLSEFGHTMLHAGGVALDGEGVLFVGKGGRGKSTAAVACIEAGFSYVGDDYVVLDADKSTVHSLFCTAKLEHQHAGRFTNTTASDMGHGSGGPGAGRDVHKRVLLLTEEFRDRVVPRISVRAVVAPRLTLDQKASRSTVLAPSVAMRSLAASSMIQLPDSGPNDLAAMAGLIAETRSFSLLVGSNVAQIPDAVRDIIARSSHG